MVIMFSVSSFFNVFGAGQESLLKQIQKQYASVNQTTEQYKSTKHKYFHKHAALINLLNAKIDELYHKITTNRNSAERKIKLNSEKQNVLASKFKKTKLLSEKEVFKAIISDLQSQNGEINLSLVEDISIFSDLIVAYKFDIQKIDNIFSTSAELYNKFKVKNVGLEKRISLTNTKLKKAMNDQQRVSLLNKKIELINGIVFNLSSMNNIYAEHLNRLETYIIL